MRKQTTNYVAINANQFKETSKNLPVKKKNPRYIYTEEDLGEGILDAGISSYYSTEQQDNLHTTPWMSMLKTKWS